MKHIPNKIYLQIGEDCDAEDFKDLNEVTWCQVEIHSNDIEYVRSSQQPEDKIKHGMAFTEKSIEQEVTELVHSTFGGAEYYNSFIPKLMEILAKHKENVEGVG